MRLATGLWRKFSTLPHLSVFEVCRELGGRLAAERSVSQLFMQKFDYATRSMEAVDLEITLSNLNIWHIHLHATNS